ncbi:GNAT family N-acetyltransferase [Paeniglutamicibacter sp. NPDC012692]|uniref:GNAT family N-acetyltransferase n=1 Tax=Paeniglutamicibacter sp. NPDC012692 TaxID=3364388 RepID=UPI0036803F5A
MIEISIDSPLRGDVRLLLDGHRADMFAISPAGNVHALDHEALGKSDVGFWTAREGGEFLACGALKLLQPASGELKSMRTAPAERGRGIASQLLAENLGHARRHGLTELLLETGSDDFFAPARRLYVRHGFTECPPFADYELDPHSVFMRIELSSSSESD